MAKLHDEFEGLRKAIYLALEAIVLPAVEILELKISAVQKYFREQIEKWRRSHGR